MHLTEKLILFVQELHHSFQSNVKQLRGRINTIVMKSEFIIKWCTILTTIFRSIDVKTNLKSDRVVSRFYNNINTSFMYLPGYDFCNCHRFPCFISVPLEEFIRVSHTFQYFPMIVSSFSMNFSLSKLSHVCVRNVLRKLIV